MHRIESSLLCLVAAGGGGRRKSWLFLESLLRSRAWEGVMQSAEVPANLSVWFLGSKDITQRAGCEGRGFIGTSYAHPVVAQG